MADGSRDVLAAAVALHQSGRHVEAEASYRSLLLSTPSVAASSYNNLAGILHAAGRTAEAEACWMAAISTAPQLADAHSNLATALLQNGQRYRAFDVLRRAVSAIPDSAALYTRLGSILTSGRNLATLPEPARRAAFSIARAAVRLEPSSPALWQNLAFTLSNLGGRSAAARQAYRRALSLNPLVAEYHLGLASLQPRAEAVHTLRRAIALGPAVSGTRGALYYNLGNLLQSGRYDDDACRLLATTGICARDGDGEGEGAPLSVPKVQAEHVSVPAAATATAVRRAEVTARAAAEEASMCFRRATELEPLHSDAYYNAALAPQQAHLDEPLRALRDYEEALRLAPRDTKVLSRLISTLQWMGRDAEALHRSRLAVGTGLYATRDQRPAHRLNGLQAQPWHEAEVAYRAAHEVLRRSHDALLGALDAVTAAGLMRPQPEGLQEAGQEWRVFDLGEACEHGGGAEGAEEEATQEASNSEAARVDVLVDELGVVDEAADSAEAYVVGGHQARSAVSWHRLAPACRVLSTLRAAGADASPPFAPLKAQFSTMAPGVHVRPHTGPTNAKLTLHYGLRVPTARDASTRSAHAVGSGTGTGTSGGARIRVGNETRPFVAQGLLVFDDSFEHEVWQDGAAERTTLVLHIAHPDLPAADVASMLSRRGTR